MHCALPPAGDHAVATCRCPRGTWHACCTVNRLSEAQYPLVCSLCTVGGTHIGRSVGAAGGSYDRSSDGRGQLLLSDPHQRVRNDRIRLSVLRSLVLNAPGHITRARRQPATRLLPTDASTLSAVGYVELYFQCRDLYCGTQSSDASRSLMAASTYCACPRSVSVSAGFSYAVRNAIPLPSKCLMYGARTRKTARRLVSE
jgi:hypothetical protein